MAVIITWKEFISLQIFCALQGFPDRKNFEIPEVGLQ